MFQNPWVRPWRFWIIPDGADELGSNHGSPLRAAGWAARGRRYEGNGCCGCCVLFLGRSFFLQIFECSGEFFEAFLLFLKPLHEVLQFRGAGLKRSQTG